MFITFIYKIGNRCNRPYYGKYCADYISDDHEGLDLEVKSSLIHGLCQYKKLNNICEMVDEIFIGILSFSSDNAISTYSSDSEIQCFDFYRDYENKIFINGKLM